MKEIYSAILELVNYVQKNNFLVIQQPDEALLYMRNADSGSPSI